MKVIYNNIIPFKGYKIINIFGILFARKDCNKISKEDFNHELIHTKQIWELLGIFFYIFYLLEYIIRIFQYKFQFHKAYRNISFEREAYGNEKNLEYIDFRTPFSWFKYIF